MGRQLKAKLLISSLLLISKTSASSLADFHEEIDFGVLHERGTVAHSAIKAFDGSSRKVEDLTVFEEAFVASLGRLSKRVSMEVVSMQGIEFPKPPSDLKEKADRARTRHDEIEVEIGKKIKQLLIAGEEVEDSDEMEILRSDIDILRSEQDEALEQWDLRPRLYRPLPALRALRDICKKALIDSVASMDAKVAEGQKAIYEYTDVVSRSSVYDIKSTFAKVLKSLDESNAICDDCDKILDLHHLICGWLSAINTYTELPSDDIKFLAIEGGMDAPVVNYKLRLKARLNALSLMMPNLKEEPLKFNDFVIKEGLELIASTADRETTQGQSAVLQTADSIDERLVFIKEKVERVRDEILTTSALVGQSTDSLETLRRLSLEVVHLSLEIRELAELKAQQSGVSAPQIHEIKELINETMRMLIRVVSAVEDGGEVKSVTERDEDFVEYVEFEGE